MRKSHQALVKNEPKSSTTFFLNTQSPQNRLTQLQSNPQPNIKVLDFAGNQMNDLHTNIISTILKKNLSFPNVETIDLDNNEISTQGVLKLTESLEKHPSMTELNLRKNPFQLKGYQALLKLVKNNWLIKNVHVTPAAGKHLKASKEIIHQIEFYTKRNQMWSQLLKLNNSVSKNEYYISSKSKTHLLETLKNLKNIIEKRSYPHSQIELKEIKLLSNVLLNTHFLTENDINRIKKLLEKTIASLKPFYSHQIQVRRMYIDYFDKNLLMNFLTQDFSESISEVLSYAKGLRNKHEQDSHKFLLLIYNTAFDVALKNNDCLSIVEMFLQDEQIPELHEKFILHVLIPEISFKIASQSINFSMSDLFKLLLISIQKTPHNAHIIPHYFNLISGEQKRGIYSDSLKNAMGVTLLVSMEKAIAVIKKIDPTVAILSDHPETFWVNCQKELYKNAFLKAFGTSDILLYEHLILTDVKTKFSFHENSVATEKSITEEAFRNKIQTKQQTLLKKLKVAMLPKEVAPHHQQFLSLKETIESQTSKGNASPLNSLKQFSTKMPHSYREQALSVIKKALDECPTDLSTWQAFQKELECIPHVIVKTNPCKDLHLPFNLAPQGIGALA